MEKSSDPLTLPLSNKEARRRAEEILGEPLPDDPDDARQVVFRAELRLQSPTEQRDQADARTLLHILVSLPKH